MPLRELEVTLSPDTLLEEPPPARHAQSLWWVLHNKPRAEKVLARELLRRGVSFYLPLYSRHFRHDRARLHALQTNCVVRTLPVLDQGGLHQDLRRVQHLI